MSLRTVFEMFQNRLIKESLAHLASGAALILASGLILILAESITLRMAFILLVIPWPIWHILGTLQLLQDVKKIYTFISCKI